MTFVAQIDLAELAARAGGTTLPTRGALAFFVDGGGERDAGAVVHVPQADAHASTRPPSDAPAALNANGEVFPETSEPSDPRAFPYWPVDLTALPISDDAEEEQRTAAVNQHFTRRQYFLTAAVAFKTLGDAEKPYWWHAAHSYAGSLRLVLRLIPHMLRLRQSTAETLRAKVNGLKPRGPAAWLGLVPEAKRDSLRKAQEELARAEARLAELAQRTLPFERFVQEVSDWVAGKDPRRLMARPDIERLIATYKRGSTEFKDFRLGIPSGFDGLETAALLAVATGDDETYATLPKPVQTLINDEYLLPTGNWHQMFGKGVEIQGNAAAENEGNVMLLQLIYDDMIGWRFGDMGAYQFWISPEDLQRRNWGAVRLTFECH
jgi:hypothetical protein